MCEMKRSHHVSFRIFNQKWVPTKLKEVIEVWRPHEDTDLVPWPHRGPRAARTTPACRPQVTLRWTENQRGMKAMVPWDAPCFTCPILTSFSCSASTQNPNKCTPYLRAISTKIEIISLTPLVETKSPRIWARGGAPSPNPMSFSFLPKRLLRYEATISDVFPKGGTHIGIRSP